MPVKLFGRLRFTLRTLFVVMTVCGLWFAHLSSKALRQQRAAQALGQLGSITFRHQQPVRPSMPDLDAEPPGPKWLRSVLGDAYFQEAVVASLRPSSHSTKPPRMKRDVTNDDLKSLVDLPSLEFLFIESPAVTDDGFRSVAGLTQLESLCLDRVPLTDRGIEHLARLKQLKWLCAVDTQLTAEGITTLKQSLPTTKVQIGKRVRQGSRDRMVFESEEADLAQQATPNR